jgi:signal transduction histidine kinase
MGSIRRHFFTNVVVPVVCLTLLWGVLAGAAVSGSLGKLRWLANLSSSKQLRIESAVVAGAGLVVVIVAVLLMSSFAGRLAREISGLTAVVERTRAGELTAEDRLPATRITEIAIAGAALARLNRSAAEATAAESGLRHGLRGILVSLAKRNQALLHRQLRIIDDLEQQAATPAALSDLFTLDHLTTRMRRNAESLTILSGAVPSRSWSGPVPVIDVLRAAAAEVEDYTRVTVISDAVESVIASAVTDMIHLLAELIENATLCSPSSTRVEVRAERVANGLAIEVEDRGLGIPAEQLHKINQQLADPPDFGLADPDRLGLFVTAKLAARHGVHVSLSPSPFLGIRAVVVLPDAIMEVPSEGGGDSLTRAQPSSGRLSKLNLRAAEVLALAGAVPAGSPGEPGRAATTRNGLPRRVRPDSTQAAGPAAAPEAPAAPAAGPAPEEARSLAASLQNSWQRSRKADEAPGTEPAEQPDSEEDA